MNVQRISRVLLLGPAISLAVACSSVEPGVEVEVPCVAAPLFESVSLEGLIVRDRRFAGQSSSVSSGFGTSRTTIPYSNDTLTTNVNTVDTSTTNHYEMVDSTVLRDGLQRLIEDRNIARRVTPDANIRIVGRVVQGGSNTGFGKITWNVVNALGPCFLGLRFRGGVASTVELRVYENDALVGTYVGEGTANWRHPMYGIIPAMPNLRNSSYKVATWQATKDAVVRMLESGRMQAQLGANHGKAVSEEHAIIAASR